LGKTRLSTPVLQEEWRCFISALGGRVDEKSTALIEVKLVDSLEDVPLNRDEAYKLKVTAKKISIEAMSGQGVYRAMQTLRQLAGAPIKRPSFRDVT
jgi:N-acetyl-beta-hexosaminidase